MADFYQLLGVDRAASQDEIKRSYRRLARELHPDRNPGDDEAEARFKEIAVAYETLSDPERRSRYDRFGDDRGGSQGSAEGGLGDIFDAFFGGQSPFGAGFGGQQTRGPARGADLEVRLSVTLEEAVLGSAQTVDVRAPVPCEPCEATGVTADSTVMTCMTCEGQGQVQQVRRSILGQMVTTAACPTCAGRGETIDKPCASCGGEGRVAGERSYTVDVPAGVDSGATLRLTGRGAAGPRGSGFGDLYVRIDVQQHDRFVRDGIDLVTELAVPMTVAALGGEIELQTIDGVETIKIPTGTQTGRTFRLRGEGVPSLQGSRRGDVRAVAIVVVPEQLTSEQETMLREFAQSRGDEVAESQSLLGRLRSALS